MKSNSPPSPRCFPLLVLAGFMSLDNAVATQTLYYNFSSVTNPATDSVINRAPGATLNGTFVNAAGLLSINSADEVTVNAVRYQMGQTLELTNVDASNTAAGYINTGANLVLWGMGGDISPRMNKDYTAMAWAKFKSTATDNMIFGQLVGTNTLHLGSRLGNLWSGHYNDDLTTPVTATVNNVWQHYAFVNQGSTQSIYVNGVLVMGPGATGTGIGSVNNLVIGTAQTSNGSFVGTLDEVKIFNTVLTAAEIQTEMTNTLTPVVLATVSSAKLDNTGWTFTLTDFQTLSVVNTASIMVEVDGTPMAPTSAVKVNGITTVTLNQPVPRFGSGSSHTYVVTAKDQSNPTTPNITGSGTLTAPVLPPTLPGPAGMVGSWGVREYRAGTAFGGNWNGSNLGTVVDTLATLPQTDPDPLTNTIFDGTAPVMNHSDPDNPGDKGNFNNDLPFIGHAAGLQEDNLAFVGKTQITVAAAGPYTFSVHSDDGFALRISGGPVGNTGKFISSNKTTATNRIDPSDPQTISFNGGGADSSTTGVYQFSAAGTYDVLFVPFESTGGAYYEVAMAPGSWKWDRQTTAWQLIGNPNDASVLAVPFTSRFITSIPGPTGVAGNFGIRTYFDTGTGANLVTVNNWLRDNGATRLPDSVSTYDVQRNFLNLSDNRDASFVLTQTGHVTGDDVLPGGRADVDNVITTAHGRVRVPVDATYTFNARGDDGFMLRIKAVTGPNPQFTRATNANDQNASSRLEMSNRNVIYYIDGTGDTLTRGIIPLKAGEYDIEYVHFQGTGGFWYELTAAIGEYPHGTEPGSGWIPVGTNAQAGLPAASTQPQISAAGWSVQSTAPNAITADGLQPALDALAAGNTISTWDTVNFIDPEAPGAPAPVVAASAWPRNTSANDDRFAMRATGQLVVPVEATYRLGYQGDDGGTLIIRGTGGNPSPSFTFLTDNATNAAVVEEEIPGSFITNKLRTEVGTANNLTVASIFLPAGTYELEGVSYEQTGNAYWRLIGAIEPVNPGTVVYYPLSKGGVIKGLDMLVLIGPAVTETPLTVSNFVYEPVSGNFSLTFTSVEGGNYRLEYSTAMRGGSGEKENWVSSPITATAGAGATTTITDTISSLGLGNGGLLFPGEPRVFLRIRKL